MTVGRRRQRRDNALSKDELVKGSRTVADRLDALADELEKAVSRLAAEIEDPNDRLNHDDGGNQ